jgi:hypothetical protein
MTFDERHEREPDDWGDWLGLIIAAVLWIAFWWALSTRLL